MSYFWLEDENGTKLDFIKKLNGTPNAYFLDENKMVGVECVDEYEPETTKENEKIWKNISSTDDIKEILEKLKI